MKKLFETLGILLLAAQLSAQSNAPIRLALITGTDEASVASDVLTAQLSGNPKIQLLERNEIEKVYREQGLSAANQDYLKLGRILGADGLLLLDIVQTPQTTNLTARLIAVKPGVILTDGSFPWPLTNTVQWAESVVPGLNSFVPKLTVLAEDAIPISVVNLRSAIQSAEAQETERQLKLLTIQRLSQEQRFFVLERQRMQLLSEEKGLKSDESAFWDGSYLLEGVVDQNAYSKDTITINARLTPPKGGAPLLFEVSGGRTNFSEVINRLAAKVTELLKINSTVKEWNAADEATQYFAEAKWALRWGVYSEAEAAVDSAWALGKRDLDCAIVRVESYVAELKAKVGKYQNGSSAITSGYDANGVPLGPTPADAAVQLMIKNLLAEHPFGMVYKITKHPGVQNVDFVFANESPDIQNIDRAMHTLELYYEFSHTLPEGLLKVASPASNWENSNWYDVGIDDLIAASQVLQNFNFVPESQAPAADKLTQLRAMTRSVAGWISRSPSVRDSYFVGDRAVSHDELSHTIEEQPNLFKCEVAWGCFWQERPDDCIALYHELMSSPVFCYIHKDFWLRELQTPRLAAWNESDRQRIPMVWSDFVRALDASTNVLLKLEGKALALADVDSENKMAAAFTNLFNNIFENRDTLVANNVEVLYLNWGADDLVSAKTGGGIVTNTKESLNHLYYSEYRSRLEAMDQEYWHKTSSALVEQLLRPNETTFEQQKQYLKEDKPYDFIEFAQTFANPNYSKAQALEIQPLLASYMSNLVVQSQRASGMEKGKLMGTIAHIGFLENNIKRILNPPAAPPPPAVAENQAPKPAMVAATSAVKPVFTNAPEEVTNVIEVRKFLEIPAERLIDLDSSERIEYMQVAITAHHWFEGRLLLDFNYYTGTQWRDKNGNVQGGRNASGPAIAILDPVTEHWDVISCPEAEIEVQNRFYHRSALVRGELFTCDGGKVRKYDFRKSQWQVLGISDGNNYELFAVNGHLYAANGNVIFEISEGGTNTYILASNRRQPPVTALDTEDLGLPTLFAGPSHSLRVSTQRKIFTWMDKNWHEDSSSPSSSTQPEIFPDGVLFRYAGFVGAGYQNGVIVRGGDGTYGTLNSQDEICALANETNVVTLCLRSANRTGPRGFSRPGMNTVQPPKPLWKMPANLLPKLPAALRQFDLYLLEDSFAARAVINDRHQILQENVAGDDEFNAALLCFTHGFSSPQKLFLKFDPSDAKTAAWMFPTTDLLLFGSETPLGSFGPTGFSGGGGSKAGVWLMPVSQIDSAIAERKQVQIDEAAAQKAFLAKYDRNHNGILDPDEKEEALDDPVFIESELDVIDANDNGRLDPEELVYFDANRNKILDPKEQAGINLAEHLFAVGLLKEFDANGNGVLDRPEFNDLWQAGNFRGNPLGGDSFSTFSRADENRDGHIDLDELEAFLKQQLRVELRPRGAAGAAFFKQRLAGPTATEDPQQTFKAYVEFYWQHSDNATNGKPSANSNDYHP